MNISTTMVRVDNNDDAEAYLAMRAPMWPVPDDENRREVAKIFASPSWAVFVARLDDALVGFFEVRLRE